MAFTLDHVKRLSESNSVSELRNTQSVIYDRLNNTLLLTHRELYKFLTVTKTVKREIFVEGNIPDVIENVVALRSGKYVIVSKLYLFLNYQNRLNLI